MSPEYFIIPFIMSYVNNIVTNLNTGIFILDCMLILTIITIALTVDFTVIKDTTTIYINNYIKNSKNNTIILSKTNELQSNNFKAIMHYASKSNNKSIHCLKEYFLTGWDCSEEDQIEKECGYLIDQSHEFILDNDIYGILIRKNKEKSRENQRVNIDEITLLKIYTKNKSLIELMEWINVRLIEYNKFLCLKTTSRQQLLNVYGNDTNNIMVEGSPWESTITFENSYFPKIEETMKKIDFFLNNKKWYSDHGIPYNMGILLYGLPGCGKTRFIKQLMNYTGRHGIDIKLNDNIDFTELKKIIYDDRIGENYIIPQEKRIIIFEDIDCMGNIVVDRDKPIVEKELETNILESILKNQIKENNTSSNNSTKNKERKNKDKKNNNLSYLLNMIDGLNECCGRIIIMTTNKIDILDKALIRPGRIDIKIEFNYCTTYDIYRMIKIFWKDDASYITENMIKKELEGKYTSAEIINIFRSSDNFKDIINLFI